MESNQKIEKAAGDWLARRDAGNWTEADQVGFDQWLNASTLHRVEFLRIEHTWEQALRLKALGAGVRSERVPPPGKWVLSPFFEPGSPESPPAQEVALLPVKRKGAVAQRLRRVSLFTAAAAVLIAIGLYALNGDIFNRSHYWTPVGGIASVPMSDGSKITLNTDSAIRVSVTETERRVKLEQGEAFFEVAKDPKRPFVVSAGGKEVIAVGTKFSVRRDHEDVRVVVTEGSVRVVGGATQEPAVLMAGAVVRTSDEGTLLEKKPLPEVEEILSWRSGVLVFRELTLADASAEFNRYNTRKIVIEDPAVAAMRVAGNFRSNNVDAFVRLLDRGYPLHVEQRGDEIVLKAQ